MSSEPNLDEIDDYKKPGPKEKRRILLIIFAIILAVGIFFSAMKNYFDSASDKIEGAPKLLEHSPIR